ncbi:arylamine N-acetyltransferase [Solirubrobacter ginsenosidimutans]|uniref:Arylamine N-acetyltransferase n=1 Tax=Solirubrobacter ginsenosidimutans TaxID=490573 RepID=A0A9X3N1W8_9ACTN|nr:arylamine N-acetyltransferase [Solirubrobacter ginsenosidimutans]MDA0167121.1 arylamine N-acetyltransferase [Solirubrobacter ginsenosidimutans]
MIDALLQRIGLDARPDASVDGLHELHRAYLARVPYEDIAVQLGETGPLDEAALAARLLANGRGGYCFELNTMLAALLRGCGFVVTHHQAVVGGEGPTNHMALLVEVDGSRWLADAGLGEGFIDPLPFREGATEIGPFTYTLTREAGGSWWMGQHEWGSVSGFRMTEEESRVADFEVHHQRLATDPGSSFVQTLVVQSPREDRIVTLRARTLSAVGPTVNDKRVLERAEFADVLLAEFGITLGGERLERLWTQAVAQHEAFLARA